MSHVRSVSVGIWIGTGSRSESITQTGLSHFVEHMVFKGTSKRSAEEIARAVDSIGGGLDAFTSKELVSYNTKILDEHLPIAFDVIADLVLNPMFRPDDIEKEKGVIVEEIKMEVDNPEYLIQEIFSGAFWNNHPLGRPILGSKETVSSFDRQMVTDYHHSVYSPGNLLVTAAGNLDHQSLVDIVASYFADLAPTPALPPDIPPQPCATLAFENKDHLEQVHLYLGVPSYSLPHDARTACYILNTILGGGMSSRLFQNIREKQGLAYAVFSELNMYRDAGCLAVYAGTSTESAAKVVDSVVHELRQLQDHTIPSDEIRRAKDHLKGSLVLGLESSSSRMGNLARQELYFKRFFTLDEMIEKIEEVSAEQVQQIAQKFFTPDKMTLAMLGRLEGIKINRGDLSR